jgi:hypothetical protein
MDSSLKLLAAYQNVERSAPIEYAIRTLLALLGWDCECVPYRRLPGLGLGGFDASLTYGATMPDVPGDVPRIHISEGNLFGSEYGSSNSLPCGPPRVLQGVPFIYYGAIPAGDRGETPESRTVILEGDVVASSFFVLSQYDEAIESTERSRKRENRAENSYIGRHGLLGRPLVNEYAAALRDAFGRIGLPLAPTRRWGNADFAVCLTHDIDGLKKLRNIPPLRTFLHILRQPYPRRLGRGLALLRDYGRGLIGGGPDPYLEGFDRMVRLDAECTAEATYFFLADGSTYPLSGDVLQVLMNLQEEGHEIALHSGFGTATSPSELQRQAEALSAVVGHPVRGNRQHYLKFDVAETWRGLESAGICYDSTLGYPDREGFRCGVCLPFQPFDMGRNRPASIWEIPLLIMEESLLGYQRLPLVVAQRRIEGIIDEVERHGGVFVPLWHNSAFYGAERPGGESLYQSMFDYLAGKDCVFLTLSDMLNSYLGGDSRGTT